MNREARPKTKMTKPRRFIRKLVHEWEWRIIDLGVFLLFVYFMYIGWELRAAVVLPGMYALGRLVGWIEHDQRKWPREWPH